MANRFVKNAGGAATLAAGVIFIVLLTGALSLIGWSQRQLEIRAEDAIAELALSNSLEQLRGSINELVLSEGASGSREMVELAVKSFREADARLGSGAQHWTRINSSQAAFLGLVDKIRNNPRPAPSDVESMIALGKLTQQVARLEKQLTADVAVLETQFQAARKQSLAVLIAAGLFSLAGTFAIFFMAYRRLTSPLELAEQFAESIAKGDLSSSIQMSRAGEIKFLMQKLENMRDGLIELVKEAHETSAQVVESASQLAQGSADLSSRTEEQASTLEQTASSMEELTGTVKQSASNTHQAHELANSASRRAQDGLKVMGLAVDKMSSVSEGSQKISEIISVIDSIAFQTNILALNAAVEAARAGDQGRGFAVVAGEVRALAQRSALAAKEIKSLISQSVREVNEGSRLVAEAGDNMGQIREAIDDVNQIIADISRSAREQSNGIDQINRAILQMEQVTQQNAALVEEAAASSESLKEQAERLGYSIGKFRLAGSQDAPSISTSASTPPKALRLTKGRLSASPALPAAKPAGKWAAR